MVQEQRIFSFGIKEFFAILLQILSFCNLHQIHLGGLGRTAPSQNIL